MNFLYILKAHYEPNANDATLFATAAANPITSPIASPTAGPAAPLPHTCTKGVSMDICTLMTTDADAVMSSCHHVIMPLRKKACWEVKEIVYIILILYILFL